MGASAAEYPPGRENPGVEIRDADAADLAALLGPEAPLECSSPAMLRRLQEEWSLGGLDGDAWVATLDPGRAGLAALTGTGELLYVTSDGGVADALLDRAVAR